MKHVILLLLMFIAANLVAQEWSWENPQAALIQLEQPVWPIALAENDQEPNDEMLDSEKKLENAATDLQETTPSQIRVPILYSSKLFTSEWRLGYGYETRGRNHFGDITGNVVYQGIFLRPTLLGYLELNEDFVTGGMGIAISPDLGSFLQLFSPNIDPLFHDVIVTIGTSFEWFERGDATETFFFALDFIKDPIGFKLYGAIPLDKDQTLEEIIIGDVRTRTIRERRTLLGGEFMFAPHEQFLLYAGIREFGLEDSNDIFTVYEGAIANITPNIAFDFSATQSFEQKENFGFFGGITIQFGFGQNKQQAYQTATTPVKLASTAKDHRSVPTPTAKTSKGVFKSRIATTPNFIRTLAFSSTTRIETETKIIANRAPIFDSVLFSPNNIVVENTVVAVVVNVSDPENDGPLRVRMRITSDAGAVLATNFQFTDELEAPDGQVIFPVITSTSESIELYITITDARGAASNEIWIGSIEVITPGP